MQTETDPAETPEDTTAADPQAEEERAESTEQSEEGSETSEDQGKAEEKPEENADEVEIVIDGEEIKPEDPAPKDQKAWSKAREEARQLKAKVAQLEAAARASAQPSAAPDPGPKPTLESCGWDEDRKDRELIAWHEATRIHEEKKAKAAQQAEATRSAWNQTVATADQSRAELIKRMPDYLEREATAVAALRSVDVGFDKLAAIVEVCEGKAPAVLAALGRDPARLKDLVETKSAARFIAKVSKLEDKVQEKKKGTTPPPPEKKIGGTGGSSGAVDSREERLRDEAMKSGDSTALRAYQKSKRAK